MENIVYEVLIGAAILGVLFVVIMMFRNGTQVIKNAGEKGNEMETYNIQQTIGFNGMVYDSSKIKEAVLYVRTGLNMQVWVRESGGSYSCIESTFNNPQRTANDSTLSSFVSQGQNYRLNIFYYSEHPGAATSLGTIPPSDPELDPDSSNGTGVNYVRFVFTRQ